jgi:hypothetical protein
MAAKAKVPPLSDPLPPAHIFEPKPLLRQVPVALKASGNNLKGKADGGRTKTPPPKRELPPALPVPVPGKMSSMGLLQQPQVIQVFEAPQPRPSIRRRVAIGLAVFVAVAVTTWGAVRVVAAGNHDPQSVQTTRPDAPR